MTSRNKRAKMLEKMFNMVNELCKSYSVELENKIWDTSSDWNSKCYDEGNDNLEIAVYEISDREDGYTNGFAIEDYCYYYRDMNGASECVDVL